MGSGTVLYYSSSRYCYRQTIFNIKMCPGGHACSARPRGPHHKTKNNYKHIRLLGRTSATQYSARFNIVREPPSNNYAPAQHQRTTYNHGGRSGGRGGGGHGGGNQQPIWYGFDGAGAQQQRAPTPFKRYTNWNTVSCTEATLTMPTQARPAGDPDRHTTGTRPAPT